MPKRFVPSADFSAQIQNDDYILSLARPIPNPSTPGTYLGWANNELSWRAINWSDLSGVPATFPASPHNHAVSEVTGLQNALDEKAALQHTHSISNVTGLQSSLDAKANAIHSHTISEVTGLQTALDNKANVAAGLPTGGGVGQFLAKTSTANFAVGWVDSPASAVDSYRVFVQSGSSTTPVSSRPRKYVTTADPSTLGATLAENDLWLRPASSETIFNVLTSNVVNNNATANTLQDVTGLSFAVISGVRYYFEFIIHYTSAATTTGSRWTINGPAFTSLNYSSEYSLTSTSKTFNEGLGAYGLPSASNATSATTGNNLAIIRGTIVPSAAGTVIARFASEVASSAITALAGSFVRVVRFF